MFSSWPDGTSELTLILRKSRETDTSTRRPSSSDDGVGRCTGVEGASVGSGSVGTVPAPVSAEEPPFPAFFDDLFDLLFRPLFPFDEAGWTAEEDAEAKAAGPVEGYPSPVVVAAADVEVEDAVAVEVDCDDVAVVADEVGAAVDAVEIGALGSVSSAKRPNLAAALSSSVPCGAWMRMRPLVVGRDDSSKVTVRWRSLSRT